MVHRTQHITHSKSLISTSRQNVETQRGDGVPALETVYKQLLQLGKAQTYLTQITVHWVHIDSILSMNTSLQVHGVQHTGY